MALIPIVDQNDNIIEHKEKSTIALSDIYRVAVLWIQNPTNNQVLLARRALTKSHDPGRWEPAVAGTIEKGETYLENILHEINEEIGLIVTKDDLTVGPKLFLTQKWKFFCQIYILTKDITISELTIEPHEVMDIKWWDKSDIEETINTKRDTFTSNFDVIWNALK